MLHTLTSVFHVRRLIILLLLYLARQDIPMNRPPPRDQCESRRMPIIYIRPTYILQYCINSEVITLQVSLLSNSEKCIDLYICLDLNLTKFHSKMLSRNTARDPSRLRGRVDRMTAFWNDFYKIEDPSPSAAPAEDASAINAPAPSASSSDTSDVVPIPAAAPLDTISYNLRYDENQRAHRTDQYENKELVLRRGQHFMVNLVFDRAFDVAKDKISAELRWGSIPKVSNGTRVVLPTLTEAPPGDFDDWGVHVTSVTGEQVSLAVYIRSDSLIGKFELVLFSELIKDGTRNAKHVSDTIYIIFNPWSKNDDVYMHTEEERQEYVLNDQGMYFYGSRRSVGSSKWYFGQFEDFVLECVLELLSESRLKARSFSDPILVARILSSLMNSLDNDGVLVGNWSGDYDGGTEPTAWISSAAILEEFYKTKFPVMFGQCWVFAALLTTVYRAIGIPARNVCNTGSAHDTDFNCIVDKHYDSDGQPMPELDEDSIWNFHCWTDAWMARPDLPSGYGGWQALDATPQETSFGIYQTGPAPLVAIRKGHVQLSYDTKFVFAEVNATMVKWKFEKDPSKPPTPFEVDEMAVGFMVVTKAVGKFEKWEITDQYKPEEGSVSDIFTQHNVNKYVNDVKKLFRDIKKDVHVEVVSPEDVMIGQEFELVVRLHSESEESRCAAVSVTADSVYYTGVRAKEVKRDLQPVNLIPNGDGEYRMRMTAQEYLHNLVDHAGIRFSISVLVLETQQLYTKGIDFKLKKPTITVTAPPTVSKGSKFVGKATFTNPLHIKLQKCYFSFDGSVMVGYKKQTFRNINPGETVSYETEVNAKQKLGLKDLIVTFTSADLIGVGGDTDITIV